MNKLHSFFHRHYHKHYHGVYQHAKQLFVFDIGLLIFATIMLGASLWFFFWRPGVADLIEMTISVGGDRVKSGDAVNLTVDYANHSKALLTDATLALRLPTGFVVDRTVTPENVFSDNSTFDIKSLPPGGKGRVTVAGILWAEPLREYNIIGTFSFKQEKSETREQSLTSFLLSLPASTILGHVTIASTTFPNTSLPFTYTIKNTGQTSVDQIRLYAEGRPVVFDQADSSSFALAAQATKNISGHLVAPSTGVSVAFAIIPAVIVNNSSIAQSTDWNSVEIIAPKVTSRVRLAQPPNYAEPGQKITVEVSWQNTGAVSLQNQRLRLTPTIGTVDLKATARENNLKIDGNSLVADATNRTALANGADGANDTFSITLTLLPVFNAPVDAATFTLTSTFEGGVESMSGQKFSSVGESFHLPMATELSLKNEARYYTDEGDQLGRGPLPPAVGETTKYWILIKANNTTNPVSDAVFTATLPAGVEFTGRQSVTIGPEIKYDAATKEASWRYRLLPAHSQTGLYFEVAAKPSPDDIGKNLMLVKNIVFTATDDVVGKKFKLTSSPTLTNALGVGDRGASAGANVVTQ